MFAGALEILISIHIALYNTCTRQVLYYNVMKVKIYLIFMCLQCILLTSEIFINGQFHELIEQLFVTHSFCAIKVHITIFNSAWVYSISL